MGAGCQGSRHTGKPFGCRRHPATHKPAGFTCCKGSQRPAVLGGTGVAMWFVGASWGYSCSQARRETLLVYGSPLAELGIKRHWPEGVSEQLYLVSCVFCSGHILRSCCTGFVPSPNPAQCFKHTIAIWLREVIVLLYSVQV